MEQTTKIVGKILLDTIEEANNIYEAIDIYSTRLYKKIILKDNANIDCREDLDTYLFLQGYRSSKHGISRRIKKGEINMILFIAGFAAGAIGVCLIAYFTIKYFEED